MCMSSGALRVLFLAPAFAGAQIVLDFAIDGSAWPGDITWSLECDGASASGGGTTRGSLDVEGASDCVLTMEDSYGDGWNGGSWKALCGKPGDDYASLDFSAPDYGPYSMSSGSSSATESFALDCLGSPPSPPNPPPSPPVPPIPPSAILHYKLDGSAWPGEINWFLACGGADVALGGGEAEGTVAVGLTSSDCVLTMTDTFGDGWNGGSWKALCGAAGDDYASLDFSAPDYGPYSVANGYYSATESFALDCLASPPSPPMPPPSPPLPPRPPALPLHYKLDGSSFPGEISWSLDCSDGASAEGGGEAEGSVAVVGTSECLLTMEDSFGDGWNGGEWKALCGAAGDDFASLDFSQPDYGPFRVESGSYSETDSFALSCIASPPLPPAEPSLPPSPPTPPPPPTAPLHYKLDGSAWPGEITWSLECGGAPSAEGGGEAEGTVAVGVIADCVLTMEDSFGDGWNGGSWKALCSVAGDNYASLDFSAPDYGPYSMSSGSNSATESFALSCYPSHPAAPAPPPARPRWLRNAVNTILDKLRDGRDDKLAPAPPPSWSHTPSPFA